MELYFENRGQGQVVPSCLWHFLANRTNIDAIKKRNQKGFVFTLGDSAAIRKSASLAATIQKVTGDESRAASPEEVRKDIADSGAKGCRVSLFLTHLNETDGCIAMKDERVPLEDFIRRPFIASAFHAVYASASECSEDTLLVV